MRIFAMLVFAWSLAAWPARAADPGASQPNAGSKQVTAAAVSQRVVVDHFQGDMAVGIRSEVTDVLEREKSVELVSVRLLDAHRAHDTSMDGSAEGYAEVAKSLSLAALIRGRITKSGGRRVLSLVVLNGADGRRLGRLEFKAPSLKELREEVSGSLWQGLGPLLEQAAAKDTKLDESAEERDTSADDEPESEDSESERPPTAREQHEPKESDAPVREGAEPTPADGSARACSWLEIAPRGGVLLRSFGYENERSGALRAYELKRAAEAGLEVGVYPLAYAKCKFTSGLGINLGYEQMLPVTSRVADQELTTSGLAAHAEIVLRILAGSVTIEPGLGYYRRRFEVARDYVPDVDHQALGARLKLGLRLGIFLAEARGSGRMVLDSGQLQAPEWFPQSSGFGFDASALLGVAPASFLDVFTSANLERYFLDLDPQPQDASTGPPQRRNGTADVAHDRYISFWLGVRVRLSRGGTR